MTPWKERDWPFTTTLIVLVILTLVTAMADPSCPRRLERAPGIHGIGFK